MDACRNGNMFLAFMAAVMILLPFDMQSYGKKEIDLQGHYFEKYELWEKERERLDKKCTHWEKQNKEKLKALRKYMNFSRPYIVNTFYELDGSTKDPFVQSLASKLNNLYADYENAKSNMEESAKEFLAHTFKVPKPKKLPFPRPYRRALFD
mmetsp:Transcript_20037/g.27915  ORF Transcript_20037/g.27915 Transcript_20037/m.27915 type:complete len:152 (-) Transcript_20037:70-525(-)